MSISLLPHYGATRTTLYTTTITAPANAKSISIYYPQPAVTPAPEFVTVTVPRLESGADSLTVLPVLVLTDVVGVIVSTDGTPLKTGTLVESAPAQQTGWVNGGMSTPDCSAWKCWTKGQQAGTAVAIIVAALGIWAVCVWGFCWRPMKKKQKRDGGVGNQKKKVRLGFTGWTGWPFREKEKDVESASESSGSVLPTRRSIVIHVPPRSPNGGPPAYRVVVQSPPPRDPAVGPTQVPPEPGPPPSRQPSGSRRTRLARDRIPEPENNRIQIDHPPEMSEMPREPQKVRLHSPRAHGDHPTPAEMPTAPEASSSQRRASQRSSYYRPRARDFAVPAAAAGVAAAVASKKSRERSPESRRGSRKEKNSSRRHDPPPNSYREPRREESRRSRRREDSDRESRDSSRETRRNRRERDADRERRSSRRPESRSPRPKHQDGEGKRAEREQDAPREPRGRRRDSRERQGRSSSVPQTFKERAAPKKQGSNAKWLTILPFALRAIHEIAEPDGGWEQYLPGNSKEKDRKRRPSASPDRRRSRNNTQAPKNYFTGGYSDHSQRATSINATKREPSPTALKPRRSESTGKNELPERKTSAAKDSRPRRSRHSTGYDGAMSTEDDDHLRLMDSDDDGDDEGGRWSGAFERVFGKEAGKPQEEKKTDGAAGN